MKARLGLERYKLFILLFLGVLFYLSITGWYKQTVGYYGFQDTVQYEKWVRDGYFDFTHWMALGFLKILGVQMYSILLCFVCIPYALKLYYGSLEKVFNFYFYSPFFAFLFVENVYSQLLSFLFFVLYLHRRKLIYEILSILAHPVFSLMFIVQHFIDREYRRVFILCFGGFLIYYMGFYSSHNLLNVGGEGETSVLDVVLYLNPLNVVQMGWTFSFISYNILAVILHNGRFIMYALLQQYHSEPSKAAKVWGLTINFLIFYMLATKI